MGHGLSLEDLQTSQNCVWAMIARVSRASVVVGFIKFGGTYY